MPTETRVVQKILSISVCPFCRRWNFWKFKCGHNVEQHKNYIVFERWFAPTRVRQVWNGKGKAGGR